MKATELSNLDLVNLFEQSAIDWDRLLGEPCPPEGRPPERKPKLERLERNYRRLHAELLRRLGMV